MAHSSSSPWQTSAEYRYIPALDSINLHALACLVEQAKLVLAASFAL